MKQIDNTGSILCELQADTFVKAAEKLSCSSEIFIRRFMNSISAVILDSDYVLNEIMTPESIIEQINEQYGPSSYGQVKYTADELFWIGYIYRYFAYTYGISSTRAYRIIKPKELRQLYPAYHTMDCASAIERILEAREIVLDNNIDYQYRVFRMVREKSGYIHTK